MLIIAGIMLVYPAALFDYIRIALVLVAVVMQKMRDVHSKPVTR